MSKTILQRAVLAIVKEIAQDKKDRKKAPEDVMRPEINTAIWQTLDQLVEMGELKHRLLSVNKIDAYAIPVIGSAASLSEETRANLLYKPRRHGVRCDTKHRIIFLPYFDTPDRYPQIPRLCREFHFNVQYIII